MKKIVVLASLLLSTPAFSAGLSVHGNAPLEQYPGLQEKLDKVWQYEKNKYLSGDKAVADPEIHFYAFVREEESPEWVAWQNSWIRENPSIWQEWTDINGDGAPKDITNEWIDQHIATLFPFPKTFLAFHYDTTNKIQINPARTFLPFYVNDPYGMQSDRVGMGYYSLAHELLHYTLEQAGVVPTRIHHCLFVTERPGKKTLVQDAAQFLIDQKISSTYVMLWGANKEKDFDPCGHLSAEDRVLVDKFLKVLP